MSWFEYREARALWKQDASFYALIMAAMQRADTGNAERLREAFPDTWDEWQARYNAPNGRLEGEVA